MGCSDAESLHLCKQGMRDSHAMSTLRCIQQILLTIVQENVSAVLCILLEILHTAEKRKQRGSVNIFLEFTPRCWKLCPEYSIYVWSSALYHCAAL